ncbi:MAG: hypothetical protein ACOZB3_05860 [Calditrichota bacterium]
MLNRCRIFFILVLIPLASLAADQPWLLAFPEIAHDSRYAYFLGPKWTAIYLSPTASLTTIPRDSLQTPPPEVPSATAELWNIVYQCNGNRLHSSEAFGRDSARALPPPTRDAIQCLPLRAGPLPNPLDLVEVIGPLKSRYEKVWFGLQLTDPATNASVGGVGWYDAALDRFGRLYTPSLAGFRPSWIGARSDSIYVLFDKYRDTVQVASRLVAVSAANGGMNEINWQAEGILGNTIIAAAQWGDTLLFSTERAIALWKPRSQPQVWESRAYAAPQSCWIYLKTFPDDNPDHGELVKFMVLKSNTPADVRAKVGGWYQIIAPVGIEGYVNRDDWGRHAGIWSRWRWGCDEPCFARITVPMRGEMEVGDFMNVKLTYLDFDNNGVKVGFRAAWAREEDLAPVMMIPIDDRDME